VIRALAVFISGVGTFAYLFVLYGLTWLYCFGTDAACSAGWMPRTIATAAYLAAVAMAIVITRRSLRGTA
jgi:hypothetical protein